jgi:F-type H+-transporting ATPase subunit epsilon
MSQKLLHLTLSRVDAPLFDGEVQSVTVPGVAGELQVLADHVPYITPLAKGTVTVRDSAGEATTYEITGGTLEVAHNHATVLV